MLWGRRRARNRLRLPPMSSAYHDDSEEACVGLLLRWETIIAILSRTAGHQQAVGGGGRGIQLWMPLGAPVGDAAGDGFDILAVDVKQEVGASRPAGATARRADRPHDIARAGAAADTACARVALRFSAVFSVGRARLRQSGRRPVAAVSVADIYRPSSLRDL